MGLDSAPRAWLGRTLPESAPEFFVPSRPRAGAPNVVVIVLDDLGFADFGCYGSAISTPRVDSLAEDGLRYNRFHVTAMCSATRSCLLTGRNHHAVGMGALANVPLGFAGYNARIPKSAGTLPRLLRDAGYSTFAVGKWHLAPQYETHAAGPFDRWPLGQGFERYYGFLGGMEDQWAPQLARDNGLLDPPEPGAERPHLSEDLTTEAIRFVQDQQQAAPGKPFFLYFAPGAMHFPHQVAAEWVEPYRGRFDAGWDAMRSETFDRQVKMGVVPAGTALTERPPWVQPWEDVPSDERKLYSRMMEVYAGFLTHTDAQIGRLLDYLDRQGVLDDTIVMVCSDNGASADGGPHGFLSWDGMFRVNDVAAMVERIDELGGPDAYNHYAWGWAWAGNTPFKLWKEYTWLGGVRVPLIVHWPTGITNSQRGQVRQQFLHAVDLMPTILEATGVASPDVLDGVSQQPMNGASALKTFADAAQPSPRGTQYFEMLGSRAIYHDGWKATTNRVVYFPAQRELVHGSHHLDTDEWSLFRVADDFSESRNLASEYPQQLSQMVELWWYEAGRNQVLPLTEDAITRSAATDGGEARRRDNYIWLEGGGPIAITSALDRGFRLSADIETTEDREPAGVICTQGYRNGGWWSMYLENGRLAVRFNFARREEAVVAHEPLKPGRQVVGIIYQPGSDGAGTATLTVDDVVVGCGPVAIGPQQLDRMLLVGRGYDLGKASEPDFTGRIHRAVLNTKAVPLDPQEHLRSGIKQD